MREKNKRKIIIDKRKFIESVYHVVFFGNTVRGFKELFESVVDKIDENEKMLIRYSIQSNVMIITISLMDELNKFLFKYSNSDEKELIDRIESYKHMIEPILNELNKWSDFRKFRNNVLAHNFRIDFEDFKSVHLSNKLHSYNIPQSTLDLIALFKYIDAITKIASEVFKNEYDEADKIIKSFGVAPKKMNKKIDDEINNVNTVLGEVNRRIAQYNFPIQSSLEEKLKQ